MGKTFSHLVSPSPASQTFCLYSMPRSQPKIRLRNQTRNHDYQQLEQRQLLSGTAAGPAVYEPGFDPNVGSVVTAFVQNDPQNSNDSYDILTGWKAAVDEFVSVGLNEITFAVFRQVNGGWLSGGPALETVNAAVQYAADNDLSVTLLPLFETDEGWRGNYDPTGQTRENFQSEYTNWISDLAQIENVDRFNIGSELNRMVENPNNFAFFDNLIQTARTTLDSAGNVDTRIGYAANFDAYTDPQHIALLTHSGLDFMGVSAYGSIIAASNAELVSGTDAVSDAVFNQMVVNWTSELNRISSFASDHNLSLLIQEFGAVQENYASVAPFSTTPGNWVADTLPDQSESDPLEQRALYESLITALDGRGGEFESVTFWTWEHQASRGQRTFDQLNTTGVIEKFAIWPTDGGGGEYLTQYLATNSPVLANSNTLDLTATQNNDVIEVFESATTLTVSINGVAEDFNVGDFEALVVNAGEGNDVLVRTGLGNTVVTLNGGAGDDVLRGGVGTDILIGGWGNDSITGGGDADQIFGGTGNDTISSESGNDYVEGGAGDDLIYGGDGADTIHGQEGNDRLFGHADNDTIFGGTGNDELHGSHGDDTLWGGDGDDLLSGLSGQDILHGEGGNDTIYGGFGADEIFGGWQNDRLFGNAGDDFLSGGAGEDELSGNDGNDIIYGDDDTDVLNGGRGDDVLWGGEGESQFLIGGNDNDTIYGGSGKDLISGNDGNDQLDGQGGNDIIYGGNGDDELTGSTGNDYLYGHSGNDRVYGGAGHDRVNGSDGDDWLEGGDGQDTISGQQGADILRGDGGSDVLYGGSGNDYLAGGLGDDLLAGNEDNDQLFGQAGDDTLSGHDGDDFIDGGQGNDSLNGGNGDDELRANSGLTNFLFGGNGNDSLFGGDGSDVIFGQGGNDVAHGGGGSDRIYGEAGNDILDGGDGNDLISAGTGRDFVIGSLGADELSGGADDDLLVGGILNSGFDLIELDPLFSTWTGSGTFEERLALIGDDLATLVDNDFETDILAGDLGLDYIDATNGDDLVEL